MLCSVKSLFHVLYSKLSLLGGENVQGQGFPSALSSQSETSDNDPARNSVPPKQQLPQDQNENQLEGQPANFLTEFNNFLRL